jgi:hypothetical protein
MAGLLDTAYVVLVLLVTVAGTGFVFVTTSGRERQWQQWLVVALVAVFLVVMGGALVV